MTWLQLTNFLQGALDEESGDEKSIDGGAETSEEHHEQKAAQGRPLAAQRHRRVHAGDVSERRVIRTRVAVRHLTCWTMKKVVKLTTTWHLEQKLIYI